MYHNQRVLDWIIASEHFNKTEYKDILEKIKQLRVEKKNIRIRFDGSDKIITYTEKEGKLPDIQIHNYYLKEVLQYLMAKHIENDIMTRLSVHKINEETSIVGVYAIRDIPAGTYPFQTLLGHCFAENPIVELNKDSPEIQQVRDFLDEFFLGTQDKTSGNSGTYALPILGPNSINVSYFLNHSDNPNISVTTVPNCDYSVYITNKNITKGEELTIDYNDFVSKERSFAFIKGQLDPHNLYLKQKELPTSNKRSRRA